ncbi:MAG TPA: hypothetical protein PLV12_11325, partial [Saprospiraceae bacterium]|nr:hypothetical protein [Saprospiraceae bacterium]
MVPTENPVPIDIRTSSEFSDRIWGLSVYYQLGLLADVTNYLNQLIPQTEEEFDFVISQAIYISYMQQGNNFVLSNSDSTLLYNSGFKTYPLSAYSRSLYYILTKNIIYPNIPRHESEPRARIDTYNLSADFSLFPNPSTNEVSIFIKDIDQIKEVVIYNSYGEIS